MKPETPVTRTRLLTDFLYRNTITHVITHARGGVGQRCLYPIDSAYFSHSVPLKNLHRISSSESATCHLPSRPLLSRAPDRSRILVPIPAASAASISDNLSPTRMLAAKSTSSSDLARNSIPGFGFRSGESYLYSPIPCIG